MGNGERALLVLHVVCGVSSSWYRLSILLIILGFMVIHLFNLFISYTSTRKVLLWLLVEDWTHMPS